MALQRLQLTGLAPFLLLASLQVFITDGAPSLRRLATSTTITTSSTTTLTTSTTTTATSSSTTTSTTTAGTTKTTTSGPTTTTTTGPTTTTTTGPTTSTSTGPTTSTTTSTTITSTTMTTTSKLTSAGGGGGSEASESKSDDTVMLIIIIVIVVVVVLLIAGACCAGIWYRKKDVEKHMEEVRNLEKEEEQFECGVRQFKDHSMDCQGGFQDRLNKKKASGEPFTESNHTAYLKKWADFQDKYKLFVDKYTADYTKRRQADGKGGASNARPSASSTGSGSNPQTGLFPTRPVTPLPQVRDQLKKLAALRKDLEAIFKVYPDLNAELEIKEPPPLPTGSGMSSSSTAFPRAASRFDLPTLSVEKDPLLEEQVALLKPMAHPLLAQVVVKPYGVLGVSDSQPHDPNPHTPVDAVIVDPAGFPYIGERNNPHRAGAASGSIYTWLGIKRTGGFPQDVHAHFRSSCEADTETRAKYHCYREGQHVIHAVGPKVRELLDALGDLSRTYTNIFMEYSSMQNGANVPKVLRLLPISSGVFLVNKNLERYIAQLTWSALSVAFATLPPSTQEQLKNISIEVCIFQKREVGIYENALSEKKEFIKSGGPKLTDTSGRVSEKRGFDWIRTKNGPTDRLERLACFLLTENTVCNSRFHQPDGKAVQLEGVDAMIRDTSVRRFGDVFNVRSMTGFNLDVRGDEASTVMEVAVRCQADGKKTVAVNAASAYSPGGAALTGGRHALEETWCTVSTLLKSILQAKHLHRDKALASFSTAGKQSGIGKRFEDLKPHIPVDGCIVSPGVEIFRNASDHGYSFQASPTKLTGVVSMAMFNMNPRMNDSPQDAPRDFTEYCRQVKQKFVAMTRAAAALGAEVLVCPDIGCGVFENDPTIVGTMLGEALLELPGFFSEVWITGKVAFFDAAKRAASGEKMRLERPPYYFTSGAAYQTEGAARSISSAPAQGQSQPELAKDPASTSSMIVHHPTGDVPAASAASGAQPASSGAKPAASGAKAAAKPAAKSGAKPGGGARA